MTLYSYARLPTGDQDLSLKGAALRAAGCQVIRSEKRSGTQREGRTELGILLQFLPGDTPVTIRIDRPARSLKDLRDIVHERRSKGVTLKATEQPVDTSTTAGKAFFGMLGVCAEFETTLRHDRQMEWIATARERSVYAGRKPRIDLAEVRFHAEEKVSPSAIAKRPGIARSSVYGFLPVGTAFPEPTPSGAAP